MTNESISESISVRRPGPRTQCAAEVAVVSQQSAAAGTRRLAGAAVIMIVAFVLSRVTGLARDIVFSHQFGTSPAYAAFLAANQIPDLLFQVLAGGAVASAFIPVFAGLLAVHDEDAAWRLVSALFTIAAVVMLPLVVALWLTAPQVVGLLAPSFTPELKALAADLARIMLPAPLFFTWGCLATSVLQTYQRFLLPALAPTTYNLALIGGALAGGALASDERRVYGLAAGALVGALAFLGIQVPGLLAQGARIRPLLAFSEPALRQVAALMVPRALGLAVAQLNLLVALYFASGMPERYAALMYAWRLMMLPLGVFGMALGTAVFPTLATQAAEDAWPALRTTLLASLRVVLFLTVPAALGLVLLGEPIVRVLFERGDFTAAATKATAAALAFYALALIAQAALEILTRGFYALRDTRTPVAVAVLAMAINIGASALLVESLAHRGLALAFAIAATCESLLLLWLLHGRLGNLALRSLVATLGRAGLSSAAMGAVIIAALGPAQPLLSGSGPAAVAALALVIGTAILVYVGASWALGAPEVREVRALARRSPRPDAR